MVYIQIHPIRQNIFLYAVPIQIRDVALRHLMAQLSCAGILPAAVLFLINLHIFINKKIQPAVLRAQCSAKLPLQRDFPCHVQSGIVKHHPFRARIGLFAFALAAFLNTGNQNRQSCVILL